MATAVLTPRGAEERGWLPPRSGQNLCVGVKQESFIQQTELWTSCTLDAGRNQGGTISDLRKELI